MPRLVPKKGEFAPGIPASRKIQPIPRVKPNKPEVWQMALQQHEAERAGEHADLRLVDNSGKAHSWAIPRKSLPKPGEKVLALPQPTHSKEYAAKKGKFDIPEGYGKGKVRSKGLQPVEVVRSKPGMLRFNVYGGAKEGNQEFALIKTDKGALLHNISTTAESGVRGVGGHQVPQSKPKYREIPTKSVSFDNPREVHQAKVDGSHVTYHLRGGKGIKVFSYRPTERATGVLEHTHKLPDYRDFKSPRSLSGTVLRGELYGADKKTGKSIPAEQTGGMLNATVWRSREKQKEMGAELRPVIFDVVRYKGRNVEDAPYERKLEILKEVERKVPRLWIPPMATTPKEKTDLLARIQAGKEPITEEGIVSWNLDQARPTKAKFRPDVDAEVVGITMGKGKHEGRMGALRVRLPGKEGITNVGTGFSDKQRQEIADNPDEYVGRVAKINTMQVFPSGRLRSPSFGDWHLEKGKELPMETEKRAQHGPPSVEKPEEPKMAAKMRDDRLHAVFDEMEKVGRSYLKDFLGGVDPTGTSTFQYGMQDAGEGRTPSKARRWVGTAGGMVGGAAVIPGAVGGVIGGVEGAVKGTGGWRQRLLSAGRGMISGAARPYRALYRGVQGRGALRSAEAGKKLTEKQTGALKRLATEMPLPGAQKAMNVPHQAVRQGVSKLSPQQLAAARRHVSGGVAGGATALGLSGLIGAGSAYMQYGKGARTQQDINRQLAQRQGQRYGQ